MQSRRHHTRRAALGLLAVLACGGVATAAQGDAPASCRIRTVRDGNTIALTALAEADRRVAGSYGFRVSGNGRGGGTDIRQGGAFQAAPGRPATLGTVTLNAGGASYDVDLELDVGGETVTCSKRINSGRI